MNLIDIYVVEILSEPFYEYEKWWLKVKSNAYGRLIEDTLMFDSKEECLKIKKGYKYLG